MGASEEEKLVQIRGSGLFDPVWYVATYPQAGEGGGDPARHFLQMGTRALHDPGPGFSARYHVATRPRARRPGVNPLLHHLNHPDPEGTGIDHAAVLRAAADLQAAGQGDLALRLAARDLPAGLAHTAEILRCNAALPDRGRWLAHLNAYLAGAGAPTLALETPDPAVPLFDTFTAAATAVTGGPQVSVLMAAHNAADTVAAAVRSVLNQTWRNLELIAVDDASTDGTAAELDRLARTDGRMRVLRNRRNVGPYASKNTALRLATGDWITGQDTDEWSHPERIARHMAVILGGPRPMRASSHAMLRLTPEGRFSQIRRIGGACHDGAQQLCPVSTLFERRLLTEVLGAWDSARFGADAEMVGRVTLALGAPPPSLALCTVLSLDRAGSLTNNPDFGIHPDHGVTPGRQAYRAAWKGWQNAHPAPGAQYCAFPPRVRRYPLPPLADVPLSDILENLAALGLD